MNMSKSPEESLRKLYAILQISFEEELHETERSSRPVSLFKKDILKRFAKFTRKHLCRSLLLNKLCQKRDSGTGVFLRIIRNF